MAKITIGNTLMILCSLFYLLWWTIAFKPGTAAGGKLTALLLLGAFLSGVAGIAVTCTGIQSANANAARSLYPPFALLIGGAAAYFLLLVLTRVLFKRQVTTELILIVGWAVLELSVVNTFYGSGKNAPGISVFESALIILAAILSLVCYVLYYRLPARAGWIDGMLPLVLAGVVMTVVTII